MHSKMNQIQKIMTEKNIGQIYLKLSKTYHNFTEIDCHNRAVPRSEKELMNLPGVGRKCGDIMINFNFGGLTITVDTHVLGF